MRIPEGREQCRFCDLGRPPSGRDGLILLEVLLAILILSVSLTVILRGMSMGLSALANAVRYLQVTHYSENVLFQIVTEKDLQEGKLERDDWEEPFPDFRCRVRIRDYDQGYCAGGCGELFSEEDEKLKEVDMDLTWPASGGEKKMSLSLIKFLSG